MIEGRGKGDNGKKEGEGSSQGTCIKDLWTKTTGTVGGLKVEGGDWVGQERVMGGKWGQL